MNETIKTMIQQFCFSTSRLAVMTGASNIVYDNNKNGLYFKFKLCRKANYCKLTYNSGLDLYTMEFLKYNQKTSEVKKVEKIEMLYGDQLKEVFERFTGLALSL